MCFLGALLCLTPALSAQRPFDEDLFSDASIDVIKFGRAGLSALKRKSYQTALNNFSAALTYPMTPELNQQIRDSITSIEEQYRKYLTLQRNRARRMEHSNELALQAMNTWDAGRARSDEQYLALQLAHWACKISKNENVLALRLRNSYLNQSDFLPSIPQEDIRHTFVEIANDSFQARIIVWKPSEKDAGKALSDTFKLDIPPILFYSGHSPAIKKIIALTEDKKAYWVDYETGETQSIQLPADDTVSCVALWESGELYAFGYKSGKMEIMNKNGTYLFRRNTSGAVRSLGFLKVSSTKKGKLVEMVSVSEPNAVYWKISLKKDKDPEISVSKFAENAVMANVSPDRKKIIQLTNENGLQFWTGTLKKDGDVKYPFTGRAENFTIRDVYLTPDNETVVVKYTRRNLLENSETECVEEIGKDGRVKTANQKILEKPKLKKSDFKKFPDFLRDNTYSRINARQIRFINKGTQLAAISADGTSVMIANTKPYKPTSTFISPGRERFTNIAPDPLGKYLVASTDTNLVYLIDVAKNNSATKLTGFNKRSRSIAFSAKGDYFLCSEDTTAILFNSSDGLQKSRYKFISPVTALCTSPSGDTIMVGLEDGNVLYVKKNEPEKIIASGLGRHVGPVIKVAFSRRGHKSLILSRDRSRNKTILDIVNNNQFDLTADRLYYYESSDEIDINYAEFSADDNNILLTRKNETILLSANFLKPEYAIQKLKSPHVNDEIKEAYLIENDQFIATLSVGGNLWIQTNGIDFLDRRMEELSLLEQIKYKVAEPDSIRKYARTLKELDNSIEYLADYAVEEIWEQDTLRNIIQELLQKRIEMSYNLTGDSTIRANYYFALARIYEERSLEQYERLEPTEALRHEKKALQCMKIAWESFRYRPDIEKKQAEELMCLVHHNMSSLYICEGQLTLAQAYADTSESYKNALPACVEVNIPNKVLILLLSGNTERAKTLMDQYAAMKCSDQKGNETLKEAFISGLSYLALLEKAKNRKKISRNNINKALKWYQ